EPLVTPEILGWIDGNAALDATVDRRQGSFQIITTDGVLRREDVEAEETTGQSLCNA
ncbi:MAG: hypothetical protein GWN58_10700, partial [Anaerolineae bacterium]|nr:hypothetical protein [Anaerolineae bacterium]